MYRKKYLGKLPESLLKLIPFSKHSTNEIVTTAFPE